jgi:hypothetical protein
MADPRSSRGQALPSGEITDAPLEEFTDPQSGIASILSQMQGAANRTRPIETVQHANRVMPTRRNGLTPEELIALLLSQRQ